jgi:DeoR family transcriptional regulator, ulaG and ulaABCDEF operon transcriptional repressor
MHQGERERVILRALEGRAVVSIGELTALLDASEATVRRDLSELEQRGLLARVHGGAKGKGDRKPQSLVGQPRFESSRGLFSEEKRWIGRFAASLVEPGESIMIAGGSSTFAMAEALRGVDATILTISFPIAVALSEHSKATVILPGGELFREQGIVISPFEHDVFDHYHVKRLFLGALAVTAHGLMESDPTLVRAHQRMIERAEQVIALCDSSKFKQTGPLISCQLSRVTKLITDSRATDAERKMLESAGVEVLVAARKANDPKASDPKASDGARKKPPNPSRASARSR